MMDWAMLGQHVLVAPEYVLPALLVGRHAAEEGVLLFPFLLLRWTFALKRVANRRPCSKHKLVLRHGISGNRTKP
jgi:hypothetical protein